MKRKSLTFDKAGQPILNKTGVSGYHFYCQNLVGDVNFSIDEWNKAFEEVKDKSEEIRRLVLDSPPACEKQCFDCIAIVGERRAKTQQRLSGSDGFR